MGLDQYHHGPHDGLPFHVLGDRPDDCDGCQEEVANPLHIHGRAGGCPVPGCGEVPQETISAPELPTVLYRIVLVVPEGRLRPLAGVRYQENEQAAIAEIEDALNNGAAVRSVHKLDLLPPVSRWPYPRYKWTQLDYLPPGTGRLTVKPS